MAIDWDEHVLAPLFAVFGEDTQPVYMPAAGGSFAIDAVFDRPYKGLVLEADGEPAIATRAPVIGVRLAQFPADPLKGDKVVIAASQGFAGQTYMVDSVEPDGKGHCKLQLIIAA